MVYLFDPNTKAVEDGRLRIAARMRGWGVAM